MTPGADGPRRVAAALLAVALGAAAVGVARLDAVPAPDVVARWTEAHPDPRDLGDAGREAHRDERARARRLDVHLLLGALGAACLAWAAVPRRARDPLLALAVGSAAVGLWAAATSVGEQDERASRGAWTLGDDALVATAGPWADTLRAWRERIPADAAVLVVGTQDHLLNLVAWTLHPRAIVPVIVPVPAQTSAAEFAAAAAAHSAGRDASARFAVDLSALAAGAEATRPALIEVPR